MHKVSDTKVRFIARDRETGHLRFESRAMTWEEAAEFIKNRVLAERGWSWKVEVV